MISVSPMCKDCSAKRGPICKDCTDSGTFIHYQPGGMRNDPVHHPAHYTTGKIECIDFIEDKQLGFNLGNAVKYVVRCEHKGNKKQDLEKAIWYLQREVSKCEKEA